MSAMLANVTEIRILKVASNLLFDTFMKKNKWQTEIVTKLMELMNKFGVVNHVINVLLLCSCC